ncbi:substrate-binding periplasmic protein [Roseibium sp.]|uniref:substrate-binding periplasmic protein n=1 Tax=Roseibium sp. TaxID=1936156 RepID=UPI003D105914
MSLTGLLLLAVAQSAAAQESRKFTIAYASEWSPYSYGLGSDVDGILPRLMDRIFSGIDGFELVHDGLPWERAQQVFFGGRVDGMVTTATEKRLRHSRQSAEAALEIPFHPIIRRGSPVKDVLLKDRRLSALKNYRYCDVLGNGWAEEFYTSRNVQFSVAPTIDNCLLQLKLNRVDIVVHAKPVLEIFSKQLDLEDDLEIVDLKYDESPKFPLLVSNSYEFADELIERFDHEVSRLKGGGIYEDLMNELVEAEKEKPTT